MDGAGSRPEPLVVRHGLVASVLLGAVALAAAAWGPRAGPEDVSPYGAVGCEADAAVGPVVDVAVEARALAADGSPAPALPGSGVEVGASVRDLSGYAAEGMRRCDVAHVAIHLHDRALGRSVPGRLEGRAGSVVATGRGGRGQVVAEDWRTWAATLPSGAPTDGLTETASWFVTLTDPAPGEYVVHGVVTAGAGLGGDVDVVLTLTPAAAVTRSTPAEPGR